MTTQRADRPGADTLFSWGAALGSFALVMLIAVGEASAALGPSSGGPDLFAQRPSTPKRLAVVDQLNAPEAVSYDPAHDVYLVSNVNGAVGVKDGNGFITRIRSNGQLDSLHFIQGGRNGVELNGPMGSRIRGDTLWVLDIDALRAFDTRTGAPITSVDLTPVRPLFTNDLTFGPDGEIYITDSGLRVSPNGTTQDTHVYRIYRVTRDRRVSVALASPALDQPDGIAWDSRDHDLVLAPIGGSAIQTWRPGAQAPVNVAPGPGKFDGLEIEAGGRILFTSWADSSVSELRGKRIERLIGPLDAPPADISADSQHERVGVAFLTANRFELWTLPQPIRRSGDEISRN